MKLNHLSQSNIPTDHVSNEAQAMCKVLVLITLQTMIIDHEGF